MTKKFLRICSVLLTLVMLINMFPLNAFAEEYLTSSPTAVSAENTNSSNSQIVAEVEEHRTKFSKKFMLSNGLYVSAVYAQPVHYEADGTWKEIDNTLRLSADGTYSNTAGVWDVSFPRQLTKNNAITISKDGYTLSFGMAGELRQPGNLELQTAAMAAPAESESFQLSVNGTAQTFAVQSAQTAQGQIQSIDLTQARKDAQFEELVLEKNTSQLLYTNIYGSTDIRYDLKGNQVKESVILDSYSSTLQGYRYTLNVGDMVPVLQEDNSIYFFDAAKENVVMVMPAPYLVDSANETNYNVTVSLTQSGSTWTLTYLLPTSWLAAEERSWPVVLDPVVIADLSDNNIQDTTVISARPTEADYMRSMLQIAYSANDGISRIYLGFDELPTLTSSDVIVQAVVSLRKEGTGSNTVPATVHKVNSAWQVETLCWNNAPSFSTTVEDYAMVTNADRYYWNITDIVREWYTGENTGMVIKATDEVEQSGDTSSWKEFYSCNFGDDPTDPALLIYFRNNNGLESYWDYTSASAGRAGTGYVNNFTGNLVWVHNDIGFGGNRMPVSISHVYNANDAIEVIEVEDTNNSNNTAGNYFGLGTGWRTNFHQRLYQWRVDLQPTEYYIWEDADGTDHYFKMNSESGEYEDEDGLELTLSINGSGTTKYCIEDKNGNKSYFDTSGRLTKQENNQKATSSITISYDPNKESHISMIIDGAGRKYHFTYSGGLLSRISYTGNGNTEVSYVTFTYSGQQLTQITDKDGKYATYTYQNNFLGEPSLLATATDVDGYKLSYTYNTTSAVHQPYRVNRVLESYGNKDGSELTFSYAQNETTIKDITDVNNIRTQIIQFNNFGNTVSIQDDQGRAQFAQYANNDSLDENNSEKANQLRLSSKLQTTIGNLLKDSDFENSTTWTTTSSTVTQGIASGTAYYGNKSLMLTGTTTGSSNGVKSNGFTVAPGESLTFSAYVKTASASAYLALTDGSTTKNTYISSGKDWTRYEVTYTNSGSSSKTVTAQFLVGSSGTVYMDCAQLERTVTASRYNLLTNGDFRYGLFGWIRDSASTSDETVSSSSPTSVTQLENTVLRIIGSPTTPKHVYQEVNVSGSKDDTYVVTGWAKSDSVPLTNLNESQTTTRQFALAVNFHNTDGSVTTKVVQFNPDADNTNHWQYAAGAVVADKDYTYITVDCQYDYNFNTAYFDGIQLYKEEFGNSYTYDEDGNVISVKDLQGQTTTYEYDNNNLTQILQDNKAKMTYTYDSWHNVDTATSADGIVYEFDYDDYGNNTEVSIVSGGTRITSTAAYTTDDNNRLASTTDALGKTTTYSYNADTNMLEWVKYPNDTDATRTNYTYDSMYRTASAAVTTDTGDALSASYLYENDLLIEIDTASTTYSFTYGDFALRTAVKIGNRTLASYSYTDDRNYYLEELEYGNGNSVQYEYDDLGRIVKQTYEDGDTVTFKYNNDGDLASVTDSATNTTTTYYYDLSGRLMKYTEGSRAVEYTYDTLNNLTSVSDTCNGTTSYTYDDDNRVEAVTNGNAGKTYSYDGFGRLESSQVNHNGNRVMTLTPTYKAPSSTTTSTQLASYQIAGGNYNVNLSYTYDNNGNIASISDGTYTTSYVYDSQNQLIRENNQYANKTWTWEYDGAGNILNRKEYAYTTGALSTSTYTYSYAYANGPWGDLLIDYDDQQITYDEIGNIHTYEDISDTFSYDFKTFTWEHGRQLSALTVLHAEDWRFFYNADGLRTRRYENNWGKHYTYDYNSSGQLVRMNVRTEDYNGSTYYDAALTFTYDANGTPLSMSVNYIEYVFEPYYDEYWGYEEWDYMPYYYSGTFYYVTNAQGDVIALLNQSGNKVMEYVYDAWGNVLYSSRHYMAELNPLLYRGYVYDSETGLYYLQSRYYDPEIGRFINADAYAATGQGVLGNNMFAYCGNDPINRSDSTGMLWKGFWDNLNKTFQQAGNYFAVALGISQMDTPVPGPADVVTGILVLGGAIACVGMTIYTTAATQTPARSFPKADEKAEATTKSEKQPTVIYRYGGTNPGNLTPKEKDLLDGRGLSFSTVPRPGCVMTTIEALNATGVVYATKDGPTHVSVYPVGGTMSDWVYAGASSTWTYAVKSVVVKWDGVS